TAIENAFAHRAMGDGPVSLRQFGYDFFRRGEVTSARPMGGVGDDYVLGPGDELFIHITGTAELEQLATIDDEGFVHLPRVGSVAVWGRPLKEARELIAERFSEYYTGIRTHVSIGRIRHMDVF